MTKEALDRIKKAYSSGLKVQIWFDGHWEDFDIRDYSMYSDPFSENRQYRIIGSDYADIAEKHIKELEEQLEEQKEKLDAIDKAGEHVRQQINDAFRGKPSYADLEKENKQLKEANQTLYTMNNNMWVELEMKRAESQGITNRLHQLIKAKELLKRCYENYIYLEPLRSEIKQFLSDSKQEE